MWVSAEGCGLTVTYTPTAGGGQPPGSSTEFRGQGIKSLRGVRLGGLVGSGSPWRASRMGAGEGGSGVRRGVRWRSARARRPGLGQCAWPRAVRVASPHLRLLCAIDTGTAPASQHLCGGRGRRREQRWAQSERPTSAGREAAGPWAPSQTRCRMQTAF